MTFGSAQFTDSGPAKVRCAAASPQPPHRGFSRGARVPSSGPPENRRRRRRRRHRLGGFFRRASHRGDKREKLSLLAEKGRETRAGERKAIGNQEMAHEIVQIS